MLQHITNVGVACVQAVIFVSIMATAFLIALAGARGLYASFLHGIDQDDRDWLLFSLFVKGIAASFFCWFIAAGFFSAMFICYLIAALAETF